MNQKLREIYLNHHQTYLLKENIRFELAYGNGLNKQQQIENGKKRARKLFEEVFQGSERVQLIFVIPQHARKIRMNKFLYQKEFKIVDSFKTDAWESYCDGVTMVLVIETKKSNLRTAKIIDGICYQDFNQPGKLKIETPVIFYHPDNQLILNIYDDRGCDIWSDNLNKQKVIYDKYYSWILDYDKEAIDTFYKLVR